MQLTVNQEVIKYESRRCFLRVQKGVSKGLKRAPFASQKGVNSNGINALLFFKVLNFLYNTEGQKKIEEIKKQRL